MSLCVPPTRYNPFISAINRSRAYTHTHVRYDLSNNFHEITVSARETLGALLKRLGYDARGIYTIAHRCAPRVCIHISPPAVLLFARARTFDVSVNINHQVASKELSRASSRLDYCPCVRRRRRRRRRWCAARRESREHIPGVLPDDKRTLFVPGAIVASNNERRCIYRTREREPPGRNSPGRR